MQTGTAAWTGRYLTNGLGMSFCRPALMPACSFSCAGVHQLDGATHAHARIEQPPVMFILGFFARLATEMLLSLEVKAW